MLNQYVWNLYLKAGGSSIVEMFRGNNEEGITEESICRIVELQKQYCVMENIAEETGNQLRGIMEYGPGSFGDYKNPYDAINNLYSILEEEYETEAGIFSEFSDGLAFYSTNLSMAHPNYFVPYYFRMNYNILQEIADAFEIKLPKIPQKKDYKARVYHYVEICKSLISFMDENNLSPYELYAFLYDFAPQYVGGIASYIIEDLPSPNGAYFIGGDRNDRFLTQNKNEVTIWQCNPDTKAGDMIVMYLRTPISAVSSIWRACSIGFIDPFFYYYRCVYISRPVEVKPITIEKFRSDRILKKLPIVHKNMQGINGVELKPSVYNHIVKISKAKVDCLEYEEIETEEGYENEKAVETRLIKPLIKKLCYTENDFKQQMYVEIGNHNKALIPDFVLLPDERRGIASGFAVIEAKRSIKSEDELEKVKVQASSYAKILTSKYCVVASKEKIWVMQRSDNYNMIIFESEWEKLNDPDTFYELKLLIGAK